MKLATWMGATLLFLPLCLFSGCTGPGVGRGEGYGGLPDNPAAAGGAALPPPDNAAYGAYPGPGAPPPLQMSAPPPAPPPATFSTDRQVAGAIHRLLNQDEFLAPVSKNVTVRVYQGVVTLRGTVFAAHTRDEIAQRVSQLPGVDRVDNQLQLEGGR